MTDARLPILNAASADDHLDMEQVSNGLGSSKRQRVRIGGSTGTLLAEVSANRSLYTTEPLEMMPSASITASSGTGASSALGTSLESPPAGSHATFNTVDDHESSHVAIQGAWTGQLTAEVSLDGIVWFPTNLRRNAAGNQINNVLSQNGLWNGTFAGYNFLRIRALTGFQGTANIVATASTLGGTYLLSAVTTLTQQEYLGSAAGGNVNWSVCSQDISLPNAGAEVVGMMIFNQDATGGRVIVVNRVSVGASGQARFRRYRTTVQPRSTGGTRVIPVNLGTGVKATGTESAMLAYGNFGTALTIAGNAGVTLGTTQYSDQTFITTGGGQDRIDFQGGYRIPPGQGIILTAVPQANGVIGTFTVVFSDGSTLT